MKTTSVYSTEGKEVSSYSSNGKMIYQIGNYRVLATPGKCNRMQEFYKGEWIKVSPSNSKRFIETVKFALS